MACPVRRSILIGFLVLVTGARVQAESLTTNDLKQIIAQAVSVATNKYPHAVMAITDREGFVLVVWDVSGGASDGDVGSAIAKAGTAAFLSSGQHAFSTRTAGFIILQHYPPLLPLQTNFPAFTPVFTTNQLSRFPIPRGIRNRPPGPLVGVQNSNLPHSDVNFFKQIVGSPTLGGTNGLPLPNPGSPFAFSGTPGGVPLYKNGVLVGGFGVAGANDSFNFLNRTVSEDIALAGQAGYSPSPAIFGSRVFADGIRLPYVRGPNPRINTNLVFFSGTTPGSEVAPFFFHDTPTIAYPTAVLGGCTGEVRSAIIDDPLGKLSAGEVSNILGQEIGRAHV